MPRWKARMLRWQLVPGRSTAFLLAVAAFDLLLAAASPGITAFIGCAGAALLVVAAGFNARGNYHMRRAEHWERMGDLAVARIIEIWKREQDL